MRKFIPFLLFPFCLLVFTAEAQQTNLDVDYLFTVGENAGFDEPGYLHMPWKVTTDSKGNIFVSDHRGRAVKMYTPKGEYITSFGGSGNGPGEFRRLTEIVIDKNDDLLVLDRYSFKVARFDTESGDVDEIIYSDMPDMTTMTLAPISDNKFATMYVGMGVPGSTDTNVNALRIYQFGEPEFISAHFKIFKHQFDNSIPIEENIGRSLGHKLISFGENIVVAGHSVYKGKLFIINLETDEIIMARNPEINSPHYHSMDRDEMPGEGESRFAGTISSSGRSGNFYYQILHRSMMMSGTGNRIYHIYRMNEKEGYDYNDYLEIFSDEGELIYHASILESIPLPSGLFNRNYRHIDRDGRLFVLDSFDMDDPKLSVYQINFNER